MKTNKRQILASVIIPTFNRQDQLEDAVHSVLSQTWPNWELIVVDDCSTDNTINLVRGFQDDRIKYVKTSENQGHPSYPRNLGIDHAEGELIAYLDDDNRFRENHLSTLAQILLREEAGMAYGASEIRFGGSDKTLIRDIPFSLKHLSVDNFIDTSDVMHLRSVFNAVGQWQPIWAEDWDLWRRIASRFKVVHTTEVLTDYWFHDTSRTARILGKDAVSEKVITPYLKRQHEFAKTCHPKKMRSNKDK